MEPEDDIILARCDTENAPKAKRRYGIDGHPVFKWFAQGTTEPDKFYFVHYTGRMGNTLLKMLGERTGVSRDLPPITSEVVKVSADNFEEKAMDKSKHVLAYLYSPWNEQKPVQEALEKAAKIFAAEGDVLVIKLPIERVYERDIADRFKVKDYPGVIYFDKKNEHELWGGPYDDAAHWVRFLNKKLGTAYEASGKLKVEVGRVKKLDAILNAHKGQLAEQAVFDELSAAAADVPDDQKEMAEYYVRTAEKVRSEKGLAYVDEEVRARTVRAARARASLAGRALTHTRGGGGGARARAVAQMSRLEKLLKKPTIRLPPRPPFSRCFPRTRNVRGLLRFPRNAHSSTKKKQFMIRKNILGAFAAASAKNAHGGEL